MFASRFCSVTSPTHRTRTPRTARSRRPSIRKPSASVPSNRSAAASTSSAYRPRTYRRSPAVTRAPSSAPPYPTIRYLSKTEMYKCPTTWTIWHRTRAPHRPRPWAAKVSRVRRRRCPRSYRAPRRRSPLPRPLLLKPSLAARNSRPAANEPIGKGALPQTKTDGHWRVYKM